MSDTNVVAISAVQTDDLARTLFHYACARMAQAGTSLAADTRLAAQKGLRMQRMGEIKAHALYLLNNSAFWKGKDARLVRSTLRLLTR